MIRNIFGRILSVASALAIVFTAYPPVIFADDGGLCPHHPEHTAECGYVEGASPCNFVCEICNPPEVSDSTEPSDAPEPEVTTSPEEQPTVTTAPEPEPAETVTTETMPEESETMPTEPLPEPNFSPLALNGEHVEHDGITDWTAWSDPSSMPTDSGNYYLTTNVTLSATWEVPAGGVNLCLNGNQISTSNRRSSIQINTGSSLTVYDCQNVGQIKNENTDTVYIIGGQFNLKGGNVICTDYTDAAINVSNSGVVTIDGGAVQSNADAIKLSYSSNATVLKGSVIGNNHGISVDSDCTVTIRGGYIEGTNYNAVEATYGYITLSGNPQLKGCPEYWDGGDLSVGENPITIDQPLTGGPYSVEKSKSGIFATGEYAVSSRNCFVPAYESEYIIVENGGQLELIKPLPHTHDDDPSTEFTPWVSSNSLPTDAGNYYLTTDVTLEDYWTVRNDVKLCLNGYDIMCGENQVQVGYNGSLSVYDCVGEGEISSNKTTIYADYGSFALYGGKISSYGDGYALNIGYSAAIYGGELTSQNYDAIFLMNDSNLSVSGGIISGKRFAIDITSNTYGNFTLSGNPKLDGQTADIYTDYTGTMTINDLDTTEVYTVWYRSSSGTFATVESGNADDYVNNFTSANDGYEVVAENDTLKLVEKHRHDDVTFDRWSDSTHLPDVAGNYCLETDINLSEIWSPNGEVSICLNGHKIDCGDNYINVNSGGSLTIYDCEDGEGINGSGMQAVNVNGGEFTLNSGKIVNESRCGINGADNSTVTINDGEIEGNVGAIQSNGEVIIRGGTITNSNSYNYAVSILVGGHLTLSGNPVITSACSADIRLTMETLTVDRELTGESKYRISSAKYNCAFAVGDFAAESADKFTCTDEGYEVQQVGSELWLVPTGAHVHEDDGTVFLPWNSENSLPSAAGNYYLTTNVTMTGIWVVPGNVELCLYGHTIDLGNNRIKIERDYSTLTVDDCKENGEIKSDFDYAIGVETGDFTLNGGKISCSGSSAIMTYNHSTIINGGEVSAGEYAINFMDNKANLYVNGGKLSSGIYAINNLAGQVTLSGSPIIEGQEADILSDSSLIKINGLETEEVYSVYMYNPGKFATVETGNAEEYVDNFTMANEGYSVEADGETLLARLKTYTITYAPGEGSDISGDSFTETKTHGTDIPISSGKFTRAGYTQTGWKTDDGVEYAFGEVYTDNADLTLYPVWKQNEIHFYKGVEEIESLSLKVGESLTIEAKITPATAECDPIQWTVADGISINSSTGETVTVKGDSAGECELTASTDDGLTTKTLTVNVTRSASTVSADDKIVTYGDDVTITAKVEKAATNGISLMANYDNKVTFKLGDTELGVADVVSDTATLTIPATRANGFAIGANTVTLEYSGSGALEYAEGSVTVTVNKKTLTATITGTTVKTYDGTASTVGLELELSGVVEGDTVGASAEFAFDSANAGERTISAANAKLDGKHAGYYELSTPISISGTISPLPAEFVWTGDEFAYDGTSHMVTATVGNAVAGDKFEIAYTGNTATEAGNYIAKVTNLGNANYTLSGATGIEHTWKITALSLAGAQVEIVGTYTYNGEVQAPEIRVTLGGKELSTGDYTVSYSGEVKDAGKYTVTLTGTGNYSGSASAEFEIAPKSLTASISGTLSKVYDGTTGVNDDVKIALTGVIGTDNVTATADFSYDSVNAGARKIVAKNITLSGKDAKNYTISSKQAEASGSITPAPITLPDSSFIYGGEAKTIIQVGGIEETVTATLTAFSSDAGEYEYSETAKEGGYTVELSSENYKVQSAGTLTIKPLVAVIKWQGGEFTYDGTVHEVAATVKNAVAGDKFEIEYTGNAATEAGDYAAKVTALGNANYTLNDVNEYKWTIAPRVAVIEWVGDEFAYDGTSHTVTATVKNAVGDDEFKLTYTGNTATEAGDYTAKVTSLGNTNYTLNGATGIEHNWKITAAGQAAPEVKIDFINETLSTDETMEFSVDGETWQDCMAAMNVAKTGWNGSAMTVKIRYKKDVDHLDGEIQSLVITARRAAPDISETMVSKSQTEITIAEIAGCEYSLDGTTWRDNGSFSGLDKGETYEIHVRYKATASAFASFVTSKTAVTSTTADGTTELLPGETVAAGDGSIKNLGGEIIIDDGLGNVTTVTLPDGGSAEVDEQGCVTVPDGGEVAVGDNPAVSLPEGGKVEPDGTVIADEVKVGNTDVKGEDVTVAPDGNIIVPGEGSVMVGVNPEITLPTGGTVEPNGTVTADEVKIGDTDVKGEDVTVTPDGKITLPEGGKVSVDGGPEKIVPAGTTVENGEINAPAIAEPVDGEILGDDIILKIESADERLETSDRENLKDSANAIVREVYDIELLKNGVEVQPDKSIKLTVSADVSGAKMKVFMLDVDGKFTEMNAEFDTENGTFSVVTDSLGIFILASEEGQISAKVVASGDAPEVKIGDDDKKALEEGVFTDEDEAAIENGDNVKVVMNVEGVSEEDVSADDFAEIKAFLDDFEGCEIAEYADITLTKITEDGVTGDEIKSEAISEINNPIKLVIDIPESLHKAGRIFSVIRLHDGKAELLNDTDQSDETVTILTDKFSLYVLIYRDPASHVHSFTAWINVGAGGHLARCAICGKVMSLMPHTMLNGVCTACGYVAVRAPAYLPDDGDVIEIEVPTEGMIANEEVVDF